jgi:hypothetical protein
MKNGLESQMRIAGFEQKPTKETKPSLPSLPSVQSLPLSPTRVLSAPEDAQVGACRCADCGTPIGHDDGPPDGWQLEDGRTVCNACCVADTRKIANLMRSSNAPLELQAERKDKL